MSVMADAGALVAEVAAGVAAGVVSGVGLGFVALFRKSQAPGSELTAQFFDSKGDASIVDGSATLQELAKEMAELNGRLSALGGWAMRRKWVDVAQEECAESLKKAQKYASGLEYHHQQVATMSHDFEWHNCLRLIAK